jgi:hypothetical protein
MVVIGVVMVDGLFGYGYVSTTSDLSSLSEQYASLNQQVAGQAQQISSLSNQVASSSRQVSDLNQLDSNLGQQISGLNQQISGLSDQISNLSQQITTSDPRLQVANLTQVVTILEQIEATQTSIEPTYDFVIDTAIISGTQYYYAYNSTGPLIYGGPENAGGANGTSASAVINNAAGALASFGGTLAFGPGTFYLADQTLSIPSYVNLIAQHSETVLDEPLGFTGTYIILEGSHNLVQGLTLVGHLWKSTGANGWAQAYGGTQPHIGCMICSTGSDVSIIQDTFANFGFTVKIGGKYGSGQPSTGLLVEDSVFDNVTQGPGDLSGNVNGLVFRDNIIINSFDDAMAIQTCGGGCTAKVTSKNFVVTDNIVNQYGFEGSCLDVFSPGSDINGVTVTGNVFNHCSYGIWAQNLFGHIPGDDHMVTNITITGNIITSYAGELGDQPGFYIVSPYYVANIEATISNNTIDTNKVAMLFENVTGVLVSNNFFELRQASGPGGPRTAFKISDSTNLTFTGNQLDNAAAPTAAFVSETSQSNPVADILFTANKFTNAMPSADNGFETSTFVPGATEWDTNNLALFTVGSSPWKFTDNYSFPAGLVLFDPNGISSFTCDGDSLPLVQGTQCDLAAGQGMVVTWSSTPSVFNFLPYP